MFKCLIFCLANSHCNFAFEKAIYHFFLLHMIAMALHNCREETHLIGQQQCQSPLKDTRLLDADTVTKETGSILQNISLQSSVTGNVTPLRFLLTSCTNGIIGCICLFIKVACRLFFLRMLWDLLTCSLNNIFLCINDLISVAYLHYFQLMRVEKSRIYYWA